MRHLRIPFTLFALFSVTACPFGGQTPTVDTSDMPRWAMEIENPLCYTGNQRFRGNLGSAYALAETQARAELSRALEAKVQNWIKQYTAEGGTAEGDFSEEESRQVTRVMSRSVQSGARLVKKSARPTQVFVLLCMQADALQNAMNDMRQLNAQVRARLQQRAAEAVAEMEEDFRSYDSNGSAEAQQ